MAEEEKNEVVKKSGGISIKSLIIGVPLFALQVLVIYYITANFLVNTHEAGTGASGKEHVSENSHSEQSKSDGHYEDASGEGHGESHDYPEEDDSYKYEDDYYLGHTLGEHIYSIDDVVVNPAGTDGKRFLLTSVGLDVSTEEHIHELEKKEILVKDLIISILSSKTMDELRNTAQKDSLKHEITAKLRRMVRDVKINRVYFSKYIIQ